MARVRKSKTTIVVKVDATKVGTGHRAHRGGAGKHLDRRTKRNRTRSAQRRNALKSWD